MKFCPKCRKKLVVQDFCVECGADLTEYLKNASSDDGVNTDLSGYDFSSMEIEAQKQLDEQIKKNEYEDFCKKAQVENGVLIKYNGNEKNVVIPTGIKTIAYEAFAHNSNLIHVELDGIKEIEMGAFRSCSALKSVTIPDSVEIIGDYCFINCGDLTDVVISAGVSKIGENAFANCPKLKQISVDDKNKSYKSIDGDLYSKDGKVLIRYANGKNQCQFIIPEGVTQLGVSAISNSTNLTSVIIPNGVKIIQASVFLNCNRIKKLKIPYSVEYLDIYAFFGGDSIVIYIPKGKDYDLNSAIDYIEY